MATPPSPRASSPSTILPSRRPVRRSAIRRVVLVQEGNLEGKAHLQAPLHSDYLSSHLHGRLQVGEEVSMQERRREMQFAGLLLNECRADFLGQFGIWMSLKES